MRSPACVALDQVGGPRKARHDPSSLIAMLECGAVEGMLRYRRGSLRLLDRAVAASGNSAPFTALGLERLGLA
jgi:hypothetical protein